MCQDAIQNLLANRLRARLLELRPIDDLREAVTTLEETLRTGRRVLGGSHPTTSAIEDALRVSREVLRAREFNIARAAHPEKLYFDPAVGFTGPPVNFPREGEEQAETPSF